MLIPREAEKLGLYNAGYVAQKRLARRLRPNYSETVALIATQILEFVRDGDKTVAELMDIGKQLLGRRKVLQAVPHLLDIVQVGSYYHFIEVNPYLVFERRKAFGMRLNIPAGTATRFEPGESKIVKLVSIGGKKVIRGRNGIVDDPVDDANCTAAMEAVNTRGFGNLKKQMLGLEFRIYAEQFSAARLLMF